MCYCWIPVYRNVLSVAATSTE